MTDKIPELEDFALELRTRRAGSRKFTRRSFTIENKGVDAFDPVTSADRAIERVLRAAIVERYPTMESWPRRRRARGAFRIHVVYRSHRRHARIRWPAALGHAGWSHASRQSTIRIVVSARARGNLFGGPSGSWMIKRAARSFEGAAVHIACKRVLRTHPTCSSALTPVRLGAARRFCCTASAVTATTTRCSPRVHRPRSRIAVEAARHRPAHSDTRGGRCVVTDWQGRRRCPADRSLPS